MGNIPSPTFLLIDSRKEDREYWAQRLIISSQHCIVLEADTGASGLAICQSQRVDCVITELELCDMSGFQVLITLVPKARYPERAVIFLSDLNHPGLADLAKKNGALAYLIKSRISGDILWRTVHRSLAAVGSIRKRPDF